MAKGKKPGDSETTLPLTGTDASIGEAQTGSAGSGASPWGGDLQEMQGEFEDRLEEDPGQAYDLTTDDVVPAQEEPEGEERTLTAAPTQATQRREPSSEADET